MGALLTCACSRVTLADGSPAILIAALDRGGPDLSLKERVSRLLAACVEPVAVFGDDGVLIGATPAARRLIGDRTTLDLLGAGSLTAEADSNGHAAGDCEAGTISIDRLRDHAVWIVAFGEARVQRATPAPAEPVTVSAPAPEPAPIAPAPEQTTPQPASFALEPEPPPPEPPQQVHDAPDSPAAEQPELFPELVAAPAPLAVVAPVEWRHPLRFVWQLDLDGRFTIDSAEFIAIMGPLTAALFRQPWPFIASAMNVDPEGLVARAIETRATWSGVLVQWPVDGGEQRLPVELSGLPVFDRERAFRGYRGFGVCRDVAGLNAILQAAARSGRSRDRRLPCCRRRSTRRA